MNMKGLFVKPEPTLPPQLYPRHRPCKRRRGYREMKSPFLFVVLWLSLFLQSCTGTPPPETGLDDAAPPQQLVRERVDVEPHSEWAEAILYFVIVDRFADGDSENNQNVDRDAKGTFHGGDLRGLIDHIDELSDLGVTALWLTPLVKNIDGFVTGAGFPDWGYHGYWADDFYSLDPRFGTEEELKELVDACHSRGIAVLLDIVYNHPGYDSKYVKDPQTRDWLRVEGRGTCGSDDLTQCLAGLPDFKTERPEVADYLLEAHLGLAERTGLDGFRLDTVKHVSHEFWQRHRREVDARLGEDFFLLGEVWGGDAKVLDPWFVNDELDAGFDFSFKGSALGFVQGRGRPVAFNRYLEKRHEVRDGYLLAPYLSSHDVPMALYELEGNVELFRLAAFLKFTVAGMPTIYYGEEVGRLGGDWPENRSDMPWGNMGIQPGLGDERDEGLREYYKRLIAARRAHPALWRGNHEKVLADGDLLIFSRQDPKAESAVVLVGVNRGEASEARFARPESWTGDVVRDVLSGETFAVASEVTVPMPAKSGRILVNE